MGGYSFGMWLADSVLIRFPDAFIYLSGAVSNIESYACEPTAWPA